MVKSVIAIHIRAEIARIGMSQKEASKICEVSQPRISDLLNGKIDLFSADSLIDICDRLGLTVSVEVKQ